MDFFLSSPLREWRLDTSFDSDGRRIHKGISGESCWQAVRSLGNGSSGAVWEERCMSESPQNAVRAVKQLRKQQSKFFEMSSRELEALTTFSDDRVLEVGASKRRTCWATLLLIDAV